jgi:hypothetical protein
MVEPATSTASLRAMRKTRRSDIAKLADLKSTSSPEGPGSILGQTLGGRGRAIKLKFVHDRRTRRRRPDRQVLDRPHYGAVDINEFAKTEHGVVTLASSQGARPPRNPPPGVTARSPRRWSRSSRAKADLLRDGTITVSELDAFIANRMKALTDGRQHPVMSRPNTIPTSPSRS